MNFTVFVIMGLLWKTTKAH